MKKLLIVNLAILVFLAITSGVTKVMLMEQDVEFFGNYGFTNPMLVTYGAVQLIGGIMLVNGATRLLGAVIVAITFLISLVILIMANNIHFTIFTLVALVMLGVVVKQKLQVNKPDSA